MWLLFFTFYTMAGGENVLLLQLYKMLKPNSNLSCKLNIFISLMFLNIARTGRKTRSCLELISNLAQEDFDGRGRARGGGLS